MRGRKSPVPYGERFGRLVVMWEVERDSAGLRQVQARCDCGEEKVFRLDILKRRNGGGARSCGCLSKEVPPPSSLKHGHSKRGGRTPEYTAWTHMKSRCLNPTDREYKNYGARGIIFCEQWSSFERFLADVGVRPSALHSIDRIDNGKGYEPGNVRWATSGEQNRNHRRNRWIEVNGERMVMADWAKRLGTKTQTIIGRLDRGWTSIDAVTTPVGRRSAGACEVEA